MAHLQKEKLGKVRKMYMAWEKTNTDEESDIYKAEKLNYIRKEKHNELS